MTANLGLSSFDNGRVVSDRLWPMGSKDATPPPDWSRTDVHEVCIMSVLADDINSPPKALDDFDRTDDDKRRSAIESLLQFFIKTIAVAHSEYRSKGEASLQCPGMGMELMVEMVLADVQAAEERRRNSKEGEARRLVAETYAKWYGEAIVTLEELVSRAHVNAQARGENGAAAAQHIDRAAEAVRDALPSTDEIRFMRGYEDREVYEMRIWFFNYEPVIKFGSAFMQVWNANCAKKNAVYSDEKLAIERESQKRGGVALSADQHYSSVIGADERYKLICSPDSYTAAMAVYLRDESLLAYDQRMNVSSAKCVFADAENALNPSKVFSAESYFEFASSSQVIGRPQRYLANYYNHNSNTWKFPIGNLVLRCNTTMWDVAQFTVKYWPPYQLLHIEPQLDWGKTRSVAEAQQFELDQQQRNREAEEDENRAQVAPESGEAQADNATASVDADADVDDAADSMSFDFDDLGDSADDAAVPPANAQQVRARLERREEAAGDAPLRDYDNIKGISARHMVGLDFHDAETTEQNRLLMGGSRTGPQNGFQTHALRVQFFENELPKISAITNAVQRAAMKVAMKFNATQQYIFKCTSVNSNVTKQGKAILAWMKMQERSGALRFLDDARFVDPQLSFFANGIVQLVDGFERYCAAYTAHGAILRCITSFLNAYMHRFDVNRLILLFYGDPMTSKSFPIVVAANLFIDGTVSRVTSQSRHARNTGDHENDTIQAIEEMPNELIHIDNMNGDIQNEYKDIVTRGKSSREIKEIDTTGASGAAKHKKVTLESEKCMVVVGASNIKKSEITPAIASRTDLVHQVPQTRRDCSLDAVRASGESRAHSVVLGRANFVHRMRFTQAIVYSAEKLIKIGALAEPSLEVFNIVMPRYCKVLESKFGIQISRRVKERCSMQVRTLVLLTACSWLYRSPASPVYGKSFDYWHLLLIDPFLRDTEEIVHFALDMYRDQSIDPNREDVLRCLRDYVVPELFQESMGGAGSGGGASSAAATDYVDIFGKGVGTRSTQISQQYGAHSAARLPLRNRPLSHGQLASTINEVSEEMARFGGKRSAGARGGASARASLELQKFRRMSAGGAGGATPLASAQPPSHGGGAADDYNYLLIHKSFPKLAQMISTTMRRRNIGRSLKAADVEAVLEDLSKRQIRARSYKRKADRTTLPPVVVDPSSAERSVDAIRKTADGGAIYFHVQQIFDRPQDPHEAAMDELRTAFTPRSKFLSALSADEGLPQFLRARNMKPSRRTAMIGNARTSIETALRASLDEHSAVMRMMQCDIPRTEANIMYFTQQYNDDVARSMRDAIAPDACDYPAERIAKVDQALKRKRAQEDRAQNVGAWAALTRDDMRDPLNQDEYTRERASELDDEEREALVGASRQLVRVEQLDDPTLTPFMRAALRRRYEEQEAARREHEAYEAQQAEIASAAAAFEADEAGEPVTGKRTADVADAELSSEKRARTDDYDPLLELGHSNAPGVSFVGDGQRGESSLLPALRQMMAQNSACAHTNSSVAASAAQPAEEDDEDSGLYADESSESN